MNEVRKKGREEKRQSETEGEEAKVGKQVR